VVCKKIYITDRKKVRNSENLLKYSPCISSQGLKNNIPMFIHNELSIMFHQERWKCNHPVPKQLGVQTEPNLPTKPMLP
jgi:hypothetical protein